MSEDAVAVEIPPARPIDTPSLALPLLENTTVVGAPFLKHDRDMGMCLWLDSGEGYVGVNIEALMRTLQDEQVKDWLRHMMGGELY